MHPPANKYQPPGRRRRRDPGAAFTLVEIILAIGLATALLLIALMFYDQAADMRGRILRESDGFATMRLVLDRLAGDLRTAQPHAAPGNEFTGDATSMHFIKEALTSLPPDAPPGESEPTDLVRISLTTLTGTNGTNVAVTGLDRVEEPLGAPASASALGTISNDPSLYMPDQTNLVTEPFADMVRFVRFRYFDGAAWQAGWTNATPPPGVEIVLAAEGLPLDAEPDAYPPEPFRRVVFLPGGAPHPGPDAGSATNFTSR
jgi:hypothetical protein